MKIIDGKGRVFGLINAIDLFVILILIAMVGFGGYKVLKVNPKIAVKTEKVVMKFYVQEVRNVTVNAIAEGEIIKDYDKNTVYGRVIKKEVTPAVRLVETADGKIVESAVPGKYDVMIYIECDGTISQTSVIIGNQEMRIGYPLSIKGQKFAVKGFIMDLIFNK